MEGTIKGQNMLYKVVMPFDTSDFFKTWIVINVVPS